MSHPSGELDVSIAAAVKGDRRALARVLDVVQPFVTRYCRARLGNQNSSYGWADDVAQEVCLAVITALPGYCNQNRSFLAFLYGSAAQGVLDARRPTWRGRSSPVSAVPDTGQAPPEPHPADSAPSTQLDQLLRALQPEHREVLLLRLVLGLSAEETAQAMDSTPAAVRVAQHRALAQLRGLLSPGGVTLSA